MVNLFGGRPGQQIQCCAGAWEIEAEVSMLVSVGLDPFGMTT